MKKVAEGNLKKAIHQLPNYSAPENAWEKIEDALNENVTVKQVNIGPSAFSLAWPMGIAASILLACSWVMVSMPNTQMGTHAEHSHSERIIEEKSTPRTIEQNVISIQGDMEEKVLWLEHLTDPQNDLEKVYVAQWRLIQDAKPSEENNSEMVNWEQERREFLDQVVLPKK